MRLRATKRQRRLNRIRYLQRLRKAKKRLHPIIDAWKARHT